MANEISISIEFSYSKNGEIQKDESFLVTVSGDSYIHGVQDIGFATEEAVVTPADIGTAGWCVVKNLDDTNYITLGATGSLNLKLLPGETAIFRLNAALYAQANTAACALEYIIIEA